MSRPYPRRARSEVKSRGVMREGRACRGRTRAGPRSNALRRAPSSPLPEISVRNKISSIARTAISESVIAPVIRYCGSQRTQRSQSLCGLRSAPLPAFIGVGREIGINRPENRNKGVPLEGDAPIKLIELNYGILRSHESFKAYLLLDGGRGAGRVGGCGARCSPLRTRHAGTSGNPKARRRSVPPVQKLQHTTRHRVKDRSGDGRLRAVDGH